MAEADLIVRGRRVVLPDGVSPATLTIREGVIVDVRRGGPAAATTPTATRTIEAGDLLVTPGVIDTHVHVNEPGRADWEGFETATRAAAAGGVTTIIDMPLNSIPATTSVPALTAKRLAASGRCLVDVGFWGGIVPGNAGEIQPLAAAGVFGFKCFLVPSGVDEFPQVTEEDLRHALPALVEADTVLLVHAELFPATTHASLLDSRENGRTRPTHPHSPPWTRYAPYLASRPPGAETAAIDLMVRLAREFDARVHIVHVSAAESLPILRAAQEEGLRVSAETCPHYLHFAAEDVPDGATEFKCAPPIRERRHADALWEGLLDGTLSLIASDHSPAPPSMKRREGGDFADAWGGIASLQLGLSIVWTAARLRDYAVGDVVGWMCEQPARLARLDSRKGRIAQGMDADLTIWDPDAQFTVDPAALHHRHRLTPYAGRTLYGVVQATLVRGRTVYDRGAFSANPAGALLSARR